MSLFRRDSLGYSIAVGFAKLNFTSLIQISARHFVTLALRRELSRLGEPKCLYEEKFSRLPGSPYLQRRDNSSIRVVSPPETTRGHSYERLFEFTTIEGKAKSPRVTRGGRVVSVSRDHINGAWVQRQSITEILKLNNRLSYPIPYCLH